MRIPLAILSCLALALVGCRSAEEAQSPAEAVAEAAPEPQTLVAESYFKTVHPEAPDGEWPAFHGEQVMLGAIPGYLSLPEEVSAPLPTVIVIHEWWGLNEHVKLWADRLAVDGYAALAIDLFGGRSTRDHNEALDLYGRSMRDMESAREMFGKAQTLLETDPRIQAKRIATLGWGHGGMWAYRGALMMRNPAAVVDYYGLPLVAPTEAVMLKAPVLAFFAGKDPSCPRPAVDMMEKLLVEGGIVHEVVRYPSADHAFANPQTGRYDPVSAGDAWERTRTFLDKYVRQPTDAERKAMAAEAAVTEPAAPPEAKPAEATK